MDNVLARGKKILLRPKHLSDAVDDYRWRTDDELARLDATYPLRMSFFEFSRMYEEELRYPIPSVRRYAIDTLDGLHIGNCMSYDIDTVNGEAEVGIMVGDRNYWNGGYGREAFALLTELTFEIKQIKRLYLHTLEWNARARRAFAGIGYREVKEVHRAGKHFIYMEITREEWEIFRKKFIDLTPEPQHRATT